MRLWDLRWEDLVEGAQIEVTTDAGEHVCTLTVGPVIEPPPEQFKPFEIAAARESTGTT